MNLRQAHPSDIPALCALYQLVDRQMKADGIRQRYPDKTEIRTLVESGRMYCQYGENRVLLSLSLSDGAPPEDDGVNWLFGSRPGYVGFYAEDPAIRGQGFDRQAMTDAAALLTSMGCDAMRRVVSEDNRHETRFCEAWGMRQAGTVRAADDTWTGLCCEKRLTDQCPLLPIAMRPAFRSGKATPWGGDRLKAVFDKNIPAYPTGESLEVSCVTGHESTDDAGITLPVMIRTYGEALVGRFAGRDFPLLLKMIDARDRLSVQVHPDDAFAAAREDGRLGKTEAWLILDAPADAALVYGVRPGTSLETLQTACQQGDAVEPLLRRVRVKPGDVCYIPAGCVHAIDAGMLILEIQQSSDITYRFYDWNRVDEKGRGRELHLEKALAVTDLACAPEPVAAPGNIPVARVLDKPYFSLDVLQPRLDNPVHVPHIRDFGILTALDDELFLVWDGTRRRLKKGASFLIPNTAPALTLEGSGRCALSMPR